MKRRHALHKTKQKTEQVKVGHMCIVYHL